MSSDEEIDLDNYSACSDSSEGYKPVKKTKNATKSAKESKAKTAPKSRKPSGSKKTNKVLKEIDQKTTDNIMDVDSTIESVADPELSIAKLPAEVRGKGKSATEMYQKLTQLEHILKRPDSYIGSVESHRQFMWVYDSENSRMTHRDITFVPGFFKIVDEILVNAADNKINDPSMTTIKVDIDVENSTISVYNDGKGIPIEIHAREKIYIPELIFGHLLTSSNYDDDEKKLTGGRNGYGAKLANIYSLEFTVETADKNTSQKYKQTWTDNMSKVGKSKITKSGSQDYTRITFRPDLKRFGMEAIDDDTFALLKKRVYDIAGTVKDIKVFLNDERIKIKNFKQYVELYLSSAAAEAAENSGGAAQAKQTVVYEQVNPRWEVAFAVSDGTPQQISFANSIATTKGGTHVWLVQEQIAKSLIANITKKNKGATVKPAQIKNHMWIFVNALIENPTFDSQTKETLTLIATKFGGQKPSLSEDFMKKVAKTSIIENVLSWAKYKADQEIKKTDGSKRNRLVGLTKLSDANNAGGRSASKCTLILTEGDSAKSLAISGLSVTGRDNFGVFPLRGKLLNVREARHDQIMKNEEIQNIKKIMGLQHNKEYTSVASLRYGCLMIMADQDHDGSHIKGLIINFFDHFFPSLLRIPGFLVEFITPIVRVKKGSRVINFYTVPEYERWAEQTSDLNRWDHKYLKGLGSSDDQDGRFYFSQMEKHMIPFTPIKEEDKSFIDLAFSKKKADDRKEWLRQFKPGTYLDHDVDEIGYSDFINKELILFSMADNIRSIPSIADGLKPGQRKVLFGCFKRNLKKEIKVQTLVGYVIEHTQYHHGDASLTMTIVNLAQDFVGSNNVNLLLPNGQYGTREQGGKDHASARYINTELSPITRATFHPSDDPLLTYQPEDGHIVEPEWYLPVVPLVLLNGAEGIGTGWSTNIPSYNPVDVVANLKRLMTGEEQVPMLPWWRGFTGEIKKVGEHKYEAYGRAEKVNNTTIEISELPIHKWTQNFKAELELLSGEKGEGVLRDFKEHSTNVHVSFTLVMSEKEVEKAVQQGLIDYFKLTTKINTNNMHCFDFEGKIKKYSSPEAIIEEFYNTRLAFYQKRKDYLANELQTQLDKLTNQVRFVQMIIKKEIVIANRKKADIIAELRKKDFKPFRNAAKAKAAGEAEPVAEDDDDDDGVSVSAASRDYDYLLGMPIWNLTQEKVSKLQQQHSTKEAEFIALLKRTPIEIWTEDLDNFLLEWERSWDRWLAVHAGKKGQPNKRKQTTLKTRKSLGNDDSDDDFKPSKTATKKQTEPKAKRDVIAPPGGKANDGEAGFIPTSTKGAAPKASKLELDSDIEILDKKAEGKNMPKRKSDSFDLEEEQYIKRASKKAKSSKDQPGTAGPLSVSKPSKANSMKARTASTSKKVPAKKKAVDSDLDDSFEPVTAPPPRDVPKRATRAPARTYVEIDSASEAEEPDESFMVDSD